MGEGNKLTLLGKIAVFVFIIACMVGAFIMLGGRHQVSGDKASDDSRPRKEKGKPSSGARRDVLAEAKKRGTLNVGIEGNAYPMFYTGQSGQPEGFEFRLMNRIASELGISKVRQVKAEYSALPERLRSGDIDMIIAGYVPDPSIDGVEWSDSYLDFGLCLIVLKSSAVTDISHLAGKTLAAYDDPSAIRWIKENVPNVKVKTYSGDSGWFEAIEKREADALIYDYPFASAEITKHQRAKIVKFNLNQSHYAVGVPAGNDVMLDALNSAIARIKDSPEYADLVRQYLAYETTEMTKPVAGRNTYTVRQGDTLSRIAEAKLGSRDRWTEIWELNRSRVANPHLIYPSYVLIMP